MEHKRYFLYIMKMSLKGGNMQTQTSRLIKYLEANGTINPLQAWQELGIYRLGARIFDAKKLGYNIQSGRVSVKNKFGESCLVAEYKLTKTQE